ncbi:MAG: hypothetical protein IPG10_08330 [Flavobacteriales bacterium]|nr:hypothetical protein [Flavobacteriales bacterium]MBK6752297.1 hypothetical protein [Flavobacteriales bacterium]MBK7268943.1 hypothetical protein [Flavobacteriales bacterium]MBK7752248.1 hypothetical protein [Flavobacteriales bacterium]MBK9074269.1 hypothetical protein [Flavobacteriales bacterium]
MLEIKESLAKKALFNEVVNLRVSKNGELLFNGPLVRNRRSLCVLLDIIHYEDGFAYKHNCYLSVGENLQWPFSMG